jgi:hypothetical protein
MQALHIRLSTSQILTVCLAVSVRCHWGIHRNTPRLSFLNSHAELYLWVVNVLFSWLKSPNYRYFELLSIKPMSFFDITY